MQLPNNTSLKKGKYQVVRCIGQGGYGITYLATTTEEMKGSLGAFPVRVPVAVKEFFVKTYSTRDDLTLDVVVHTEEGKALVPQLRKDFLREARCMAKMKHPNIVKVIDVFEEHQTAYYVMQYLEGGSLADKVGASGPLDCGKARKYTFQIGQALSYLHEQRICHYDVKPANIMLPEEDKAVLIDFGISRHYDEQGNATTARPVGHSGGFSSPEQILGDTQRFSPAADIYSLAALLYFMVTGKVPQESPESDGKHDDYPPGTPQEIRNAVRAGMNADPGKRPGTVNEWLAMLDDSTRPRTGKGVSEDKGNTPSTPPNPGPPAGPATGRWRKWLIALLCLALGIAAACLFIFLNKTDNKTALKTEVRDMLWNRKNRYGNTYTYTGTVIDSVPNGNGRAAYSDGSSYEGRFVDGMRDGDNASFTDKDGNTFTGTFRHDSIVQGRITAPDGLYYEGRFANDEPFQGTWHTKNGEVVYQVVNGKLTNKE